MNATTRKLILTALAVLATGTAAASDTGIFSGRFIGPVAELSADERAWLRDRWQQLPADERDAMQRRLRQELPDLPPEARQQRRQELKDRLEQRRDQYQPRDERRRESEEGYGQGYGSRYWEAPNRDDGRRGRR